MQIRTTVDIPSDIHEELRRRAERTGTSIRSLIVGAIEQAYRQPQKGSYVMGPLVKGTGDWGPSMPVDENPHDIVFS